MSVSSKKLILYLIIIIRDVSSFFLKRLMSMADGLGLLFAKVPRQ